MAIKNVCKEQLKRCIFLVEEEFNAILDKHNIKPEYSYDGLTFYDKKNQDDLTDEDINNILSDYFGIKVTSVHMDDCDHIGVWIVYKED